MLEVFAEKRFVRQRMDVGVGYRHSGPLSFLAQDLGLAGKGKRRCRLNRLDGSARVLATVAEALRDAIDDRRRRLLDGSDQPKRKSYVHGLAVDIELSRSAACRGM